MFLDLSILGIAASCANYGKIPLVKRFLAIFSQSTLSKPSTTRQTVGGYPDRLLIKNGSFFSKLEKGKTVFLTTPTHSYVCKS